MGFVHGVGINDVDYITERFEYYRAIDGKLKKKRTWMCPFYNHWVGMIERSFSKRRKALSKSYKDVTCCEEWYSLSAFKAWMEGQVWEGKQLDKDLIVYGNKVYSPDTCAFVSQVTNSFIIYDKDRIGEYALGVTHDVRTANLKAQCKNPFTRKSEYLGSFAAEYDAHEAWRKRKHELAQLVAETESDPRVVAALKKRYSIEEWYKHNPVPSYRTSPRYLESKQMFLE